MRRSKAEWTIPLLVFYEKSSKIDAKVRGKSGKLCCNQQGGLKTKFGPLCLFNFIKNLLDYRGLSTKMSFVGSPILLLSASIKVE